MIGATGGGAASSTPPGPAHRLAELKEQACATEWKVKKWTKEIEKERLGREGNHRGGETGKRRES